LIIVKTNDESLQLYTILTIPRETDINSLRLSNLDYINSSYSSGEHTTTKAWSSKLSRLSYLGADWMETLNLLDGMD